MHHRNVFGNQNVNGIGGPRTSHDIWVRARLGAWNDAKDKLSSMPGRESASMVRPTGKSRTTGVAYLALDSAHARARPARGHTDRSNYTS